MKKYFLGILILVALVLMPLSAFSIPPAPSGSTTVTDGTTSGLASTIHFNAGTVASVTGGVATVNNGSGSMTWPTGTAGIAVYGGSSNWSPAYNASNPIPANYLPDLSLTYQPLDAALTDISGLTLSQGDILYYNGTNVMNLAAGTSGYVLASQGPGANPHWVSGGGSMVYPGAGVAVSTGSAWGTSLGDVASSSGATDAGKLPLLDSSGLLDPSFLTNVNLTLGTISGGGGGFTVDSSGNVVAASVSVTRVNGSPSYQLFYEDPANGDYYITFTAPSTIASDKTQTLPDRTGTVALTTLQNINLTSNTTLTTSQVSGTTINNYGASGSITFTLPAAASGYNFIIDIGTAQTVLVKPNATAPDTIYLNATALTAGYSVTSGSAGVGSSITFHTFQTGASTWAWIATSGDSNWADNGS